MAVEGRGITQLTALVKPTSVDRTWTGISGALQPWRTRVPRGGGLPACRRPEDSGRNRSNPEGSQGSRRPDFAIPKTVAPPAHGLTSHRCRSQCCPNFLQSATNAPARFHRFQEIQSGSSTPSTARLYDLCTRCGRTVDKKGTFPRLQNYPQVSTQA